MITSKINITKNFLWQTILFIFCLYLFCLTSLAAEVQVYDFANLFTLDQVEQLETHSKKLSEAYQMDVGIVTTDYTNGKSAMEYADDFYDENSFGYGNNKDGLILLIDMDNREIYISTCGSGIQYFTDLRISKMLDSAYTYISEGNYYDTATDFLSQVEKYLNAGIPENQYSTDRPYSDPREDYHNPHMQEAPPVHVPFTNSSGQPLNFQSILLSIMASLIGAGIIAWIVRSLVAYSYKKPRNTTPQTRPDDLSVHYTQREDRFVTSHTSRVKIQTNNNSGGGSSSHSGRSSIHHSSHGTSHGGGGRKF